MKKRRILARALRAMSSRRRRVGADPLAAAAAAAAAAAVSPRGRTGAPRRRWITHRRRRRRPRRRRPSRSSSRRRRRRRHRRLHQPPWHLFARRIFRLRASFRRKESFHLLTYSGRMTSVIRPEGKVGRENLRFVVIVLFMRIFAAHARNRPHYLMLDVTCSCRSPPAVASGPYWMVG
jgi:hypothetical protein